jgi:membrane protein implicated in regulation of membrane protease activity
MAESTFWWLAAGLMVLAELLTGTFYMLMLALGLAVAARAGGAGVLACHLVRRRRPAALPAASNPDVNQDIGQQVHVEHWRTDGTARVHYRGSSWQVRLRGAQAGHPLPAPGTYVIRALDGNELVVDR